jgi:UMF1 family MFS transporter
VIAAQGRGESAETFVPVTMLIVAGVFAAAALPAFLVLKERATPRADAASEASVSGALRRVADTLRHARGYADFWRLMLCGAAYQAGISVVIALAAVYAEEAMGFQQQQTMMLVFLVNIAAASGAFAFGYAQDRVGHKAALAWTLVGWIVMVAIAAFTRSVAMFWVAATLAGLCMGSSQSCGRAMVGYLAPASRLAEFYGLWALATRLSAVVGPLVYGLVTWMTGGNHRLAILATGSFFVLGLLLLRGIDVERGHAAARAADAGAPAGA